MDEINYQCMINHIDLITERKEFSSFNVKLDFNERTNKCCDWKVKNFCDFCGSNLVLWAKHSVSIKQNALVRSLLSNISPVWSSISFVCVCVISDFICNDWLFLSIDLLITLVGKAQETLRSYRAETRQEEMLIPKKEKSYNYRDNEWVSTWKDCCSSHPGRINGGTARQFYRSL